VASWMYYSFLVIILWGIVGLFQKLGTNRASPLSLVIWLTVGYGLLLPWLLPDSNLLGLTWGDFLIGVLGGITNGLGVWALFASLETGAKASVAVPLTALNPVITIMLALAFLGERLTRLQWIGISLAILAGVLISCETGPEGIAGADGLSSTQ
jgi:bacterial/archaeal transporter family protein